jgi:hypothetical protein
MPAADTVRPLLMAAPPSEAVRARPHLVRSRDAGATHVVNAHVLLTGSLLRAPAPSGAALGLANRPYGFTAASRGGQAYTRQAIRKKRAPRKTDARGGRGGLRSRRGPLSASPRCPRPQTAGTPCSRSGPPPPSPCPACAPPQRREPPSRRPLHRRRPARPKAPAAAALPVLPPPAAPQPAQPGAPPGGASARPLWPWRPVEGGGKGLWLPTCASWGLWTYMRAGERGGFAGTHMVGAPELVAAEPAAC